MYSRPSTILAMKNPARERINLNKNEALTRLFLRELSVPTDVIAQIAASEHVHDQVQVLSVLKRIIHVDQERIRYFR